MKNLILILSIFIFGSCSSNEGANTCISKLQNSHEIVYSIDAFNYVVVDSNKTYHYIANFRSCSDDEYTIIQIK